MPTIPTAPTMANTEPAATILHGLQIRKLENLYSNDEFADSISEFQLLAPPPCFLINVADRSKLAADNVSHVRVDLTDGSSLILQLIPCQDIAQGMAYVHHPRGNHQALHHLISSISEASKEEIEEHQRQLKENLQHILEQKNRTLQRLQQSDQWIPIQFVSEGR